MRTKIGRITALLAVIAAMTGMAMAETITGTVTSSATGLAISGANVTASDGSTTTTGGNGVYGIIIAPGTYTVIASAIGYNSISASVTVNSGATVTQNFALTEDCPSSTANLWTNAPAFNSVSVSTSDSGTVRTYKLDTATLNPSNGVPGVIELCSKPTPGFTGFTSDLTALYGSWKVDRPDSSIVFGFQRNDGNPTNIPINGATGINVGQADFSHSGGGGLPTSEIILLHINDYAECQSTDPGSNTCWRKPGVLPPTQIPEFPSVALPAASALVILFMFQRRKKEV